MLLTGMRHGTEAMNVRWKDCEWYEADGVRYLRVRVSGKTGERYLIAKHEALRVLQRLHSRQQDIAARALEQVLGRADLLLFRNALGMRPRSFNGTWAKLMCESEMKRNTAWQLKQH